MEKTKGPIKKYVLMTSGLNEQAFGKLGQFEFLVSNFFIISPLGVITLPNRRAI